jgi:hypothetical protein
MEKDLIETKVLELPDCDFCHMFEHSVSGTKAEYDAKAKDGPWAYMCYRHWRSKSFGRLGMGWGQKLVVAVKE